MTLESINPARWLLHGRAMVLSVLLCAMSVFAGMAHAGYAAIVVDATTGKVLDSVNADQRDYPASLTKMMTLYLTFHALKSGRFKLDQKLSVSSWAANKSPTKLGLRRGQTISVQDCILGMVTKSANDAATVVAEGLGGSEHQFADMMNAQAALLGMTDTHFANASGLPDPNNTSTAHDLVKLAMALYRDFPQYSPYFATQEFTFRGRLVRGHNHLMDRYPGMDGLKTGFTDASGFNLASTAVRNGHRLFGVVLGSRTAAVRDKLMAKLLDNGFEQRPTPPILVAEAAGVRPGSRAARILAALSPIETADADTIPVARHHHVRRAVTRQPDAKHVAVVHSACGTHHRSACRHVAVHHPAHRRATTTRLARHSVKKPVVIASQRELADKAP
ncbi:MAG: D-alanyl-D-alanine carboxypeptidase family protein [Rhodanobacter sp.]